jgi:hypothetical protein
LSEGGAATWRCAGADWREASGIASAAIAMNSKLAVLRMRAIALFVISAPPVNFTVR